MVPVGDGKSLPGPSVCQQSRGMTRMDPYQLLWFLIACVSESSSMQQKAEAAFIGVDSAATETCSGLDDAQLRQLDNINGSMPVSFEKMPFLSFYPYTSARSGGRSRSPITPQRQCWTSPLTVGLNDPLEKRTLCPWSWRPNVDRKRVPAVILEAQCECDKFRLHGQSRSSDTGTPTVIEYNCEQLTYRMRVIKFLDEACREYRVVYEEVAVACIPVKQPSRVVSERQTAIRQFIDNLPRDY